MKMTTILAMALMSFAAFGDAGNHGFEKEPSKSNRTLNQPRGTAAIDEQELDQERMEEEAKTNQGTGKMQKKN